MLLSEILAELQTIYTQHGDLPVTVKVMGHGGSFELHLSSEFFKSIFKVERHPTQIWGDLTGKRVIIDKT